MSESDNSGVDDSSITAMLPGKLGKRKQVIMLV